MSILDNRPGLAAAVNAVAEVALYLWEKGWAERNGGNITVNITDHVDEAMRALPAITGPKPVGRELKNLKDNWFYCKGTQKRMRDLARNPMENGSIIRITPDGLNYEIVADFPVAPTSELPSHLAAHDHLAHRGVKATLHTHPIELVAMSHNPAFLEKDALTDILWSMIPETKAFCPKGLGIVRYMLPGSSELADATLATLDEDYDVVFWEKHGVFAADTDIMAAFDQVDVLNKAAQIYKSATSMGFIPEGMTKAQMAELSRVFGLPK